MNLKFENESVEFKREYSDKVIKTVLAFANTTGGTVYVGIDDNGNVFPFENLDKTFQKITNTVRDSILPDVTFFVKHDIENNETIKIIVSEGTKKPYCLKDKGYVPSGVFVRQGSSTVSASMELIRRMIKETDGDKFEDERSIEQELTFNTTSEEFNSKNLKFEENHKTTLGIKNKDGIYTNLGLLFSEQCNFTVKVAVFNGIKKDEFKHRQEFSGSIFKQLQNAFQFLDFCNKLPAKIVGLERIERYDYPKKSVREALVNAIIHRDYSLGGSIFINIFDDRIEFISPGGLVKGFEEKDLFSGLSMLRNEKIANIFFRLKHIEAYGMGIQKIMESYEEYELKPKIEIFPNVFKITLYNINYFNKLIPQIDNEHKLVLEYLKNNNFITQKNVQEILKVKQSRAYDILRDMKKNKLILLGNKRGEYVSSIDNIERYISERKIYTDEQIRALDDFDELIGKHKV